MLVFLVFIEARSKGYQGHSRISKKQELGKIASNNYFKHQTGAFLLEK